jgi:uncharacterized coiled-coil protein SlyX
MKTPYLILVVVASITTTLAVSPPPDGGYPNQNTAEGEDALFSLTTGAANTALGYHALHDITDSSQNTAIGSNALAVSTAGPNTAVGAYSLNFSTTGVNNTAVGDYSQYSTTTGHDNTSIGYKALEGNTTQNFNTVVGAFALVSGNGSDNVAIGYSALGGGGNQNVAIGEYALGSYGNQNVAIGYTAMQFVGGNGNIGIGYGVGGQVNFQQPQNLIYIGTRGVSGESSAIRIGDSGVQTSAFIAGISGVTVPDGVDVVINSSGQLGTLTSSARYKEAIRPMADTSKVVLGLRPVSFSYKKTLDPAESPQFGLVAEEVEKVDPDLVARDSSGRPYSVRYQAVNAMLLNEFQKEHRELEQRTAIIKSQEEKIEQLEAAVGRLESALNQQRDQLDKLADRTAIHEAPERVVENQ